jgi:uncharacterized protein YjbI with pentapeptide repeats
MAQRPDAQQSATTEGSQGTLQLASGQSLPDAQARKKGWTGFATKTLWDWMQLLIIPFVLAGGTLWFNVQQANTSATQGRQQHASDQQIATDQQDEAILTTYINDIGNLLTTNHLRSSQPGAEVRVVARAKTFVALKKLDGERKGELIQFLYEAHLIGYTSVDAKSGAVSQTASIVNLYGIDASQADLTRAYLEGADLEGVDLEGAKFEGADISKANLRYARIEPEQLFKTYSLENTLLPDGSQFPSRSWLIPGRGANCVQWTGGSCTSQQELEKSPTPSSPPPYP